MGFVRATFGHEAGPICKEYIILRVLLFLVHCFEIAIRPMSLAVKSSRENQVKKRVYRNEAHWCGRFRQLSGRFIPGCGQAGQKITNSPGPGSLPS